MEQTEQTTVGQETTTAKPVGQRPKWKGDGIAIWENTAKTDGKKYLSVKIAGHNPIAAFINEPKEQ